MKKLRKFLTILTTILVVIALAWTIISLIPPKAAVEGDNPWRKTDQTLISAHRGGANLNPENTEMAFDYVINETTYTDIVEIDIRVTKDNELVIIHDDSINRTGIKGEVDNDNLLLINDLTYDELVQYNLGVNFEKDGVKPYENLTTKEADEKGLTIMKFEEFLIKYQSSRYFRLLLEIKDSKELGVRAVDMAEEIIAKYANWDDRIMIISFTSGVVEHVIENYPGRYVAGMGYGMVPQLAGSLLALDSLFKSDYQSIQTSMEVKAGPISLNCATKRFVNSAHKRNQCVAYWTIDDEEDMKYLISIGADVITTDNPDVLARVVGKIK